MLDALGKLAARVTPVKYLALVTGGLFLLAAAVIVLSAGDERYLIPSIVGLLWSLSTYALIQTFRFVPPAVVAGEGIFGRLKRRLRRGWYWLLALVCAGSTVAVVAVSFRLGSIWWREFNR